MLPVLGAAAIQEVDAETIRKEGIGSLDLMERAAQLCVDRILQLYGPHGEREPASVDVLVVAGPGNNGGDGLAIARLLHNAGVRVKVLHTAQEPGKHADRDTNLDRARAAGVDLYELSRAGSLPVIGASGILVDALFGSGLDRRIDGRMADVVRAMNACGREIVAIDVPSGLLLEQGDGQEPGAIIEASRTLTFEVPKQVFFFAENERYVGEWEVLPIGLDPDAIRGQVTAFHLIEEADVLSLLRPRPRFAHKGSFGHAFLVAGGSGKAGAAVLATRSALRSGAGLVTVGCSEDARVIVQTATPEAMCQVLGQEGTNRLPAMDAFSAVGVGPGVGVAADMVLVVKNLLRSMSCPGVIDADALNILATNPTWLAFLPKDCVLTPHPKEFDRLTGVVCTSGKERLERAREMAVRWQCHIVLKGAWSAICDPAGRVFFNPTGNPGMAKGGSGDVLTGLLTGLLAQGHAPREACVLGVYLHGLAGDLTAARIGMDGMTAMDLADALPAAWRHLRDRSEQLVR